MDSDHKKYSNVDGGGQMDERPPWRPASNNVLSFDSEHLRKSKGIQ